MKRILRFCVVIFLAFLLNGCAGAKIKQDQEIGILKTQVQQLENEIQLRDKKQKETEKLLENEKQMRLSLEEQLKQKEEASEFISLRGDYKYSRDFVIKIQSALKNAGFDPGPIDGKMGERTKKAVVEFQKTNALEPDGIVGRKTWSKLQGFLP